MAEAAESIQWMCGVCRYVYEPDVGDPKNSIPPGTPFEELPEGWVCPICKAAQEKFFDV